MSAQPCTCGRPRLLRAGRADYPERHRGQHRASRPLPLRYRLNRNAVIRHERYANTNTKQLLAVTETSRGFSTFALDRQPSEGDAQYLLIMHVEVRF